MPKTTTPDLRRARGARRLRLALALAAALSPASAHAAAGPDVQLDVQELKLDNGMTFLFYRREGDPNVACGWTAKVGSVNEHPGITGLSHLFEHMMFKGTHVIGTKDIKADLGINADQDRVRLGIRREQAELDRRARLGEIADANDPGARSAAHQDLLKAFDELVKKQKDLLIDNEFDKVYTNAGGTGMNAFTNHDLTAYFVNLPANKLELWCLMESDRLGNPVFRQFYSERDVVWEERRMRTDSTPTGKLDEQFEAMFWVASPYSWPVIGWPSDLDGITREEANAYFDRNYSPNNLTAALVGDFDVAEAKALVQKYFGRLKRSKLDPEPIRTFDPPQLGRKRLEAEAETQPTVTIRWHAVPHGHVDEPVLSALSDLLNGETGRLTKALVKDKKIATSAEAQQDGRPHGGYFEVSGVAAGEHEPEEVERALLEQVHALQQSPIDEHELQKVKNQAVATKYRRLDGNFLIMIQLVIYDAFGSWRDMQAETDKYLAVTPADIQRVAKKYLVDDATNTAVYRTKKGAAPADPLWSALTPEQQQMAGSVKAQVGAATTVAQLEPALAQMAAAKAQAPPEAQPFIAWAESYIKARIEALKGGAK